MKHLLCWLSFLSAIYLSPLHAQNALNIPNGLVQKMKWYGTKNNPSVLFVHFDKNIYASNEKVWFTAYLIKAKQRLDAHHTLAVSLIRNDDSTVLSEEKFLMVKGLSFGRMILPDSLAPGHYSLLVYTNLLANGKPAASFLQPITIKSEAEPLFSASLKLAEEIKDNSDSVKLSFKASSKGISTLVSHADITYTLGSGPAQVKKKLKTDVYGALDFKVPLKQQDAGSNRLRLQASFKKETRNLQLVLPVSNNQPVVKFFPEGGELYEGNKTVIGWEVKNAFGEPLMVSGILFEEGQAIDTIQTNGYGMGRFTIQAKAGQQYSVRVIRNGLATNSYPLPKAMKQGPSVFVAKAVCNDTLLVSVQDRMGSMFHCLVHNYTENFLSFPLDMRVNTTRSFRIPLTNVPKGLVTFTVLDSSGRPVAERIFFAHDDQRPEVQIKTDQPEYQTRKEIKLSLQLKDMLGKPVNGIVSVACVQNNRIDPQKMTDIESYTYLDNELNPLPFKNNPMGNEREDHNYREDILLIKGWRRYTWPDLLQAQVEDTVQQFHSLLVSGDVLRNEKKVTKPFTLTAMDDAGGKLITTDSAGHFTIANEMLLLEPERKMFVSLNDKNKEDYTVRINDPYADLTRKLRALIGYEDFDAGDLERSSDEMILKQGEKATVLQEVIVTANKKEGLAGLGFVPVMGRNKCGDYVCDNNVLNCPNHPIGSNPIAGRKYRYYRGRDLIVKEYVGCFETEKENRFAIFFKGIYRAKEFYNTDYTTVNDSEQMFLSTIFWEYSVTVNSNKPTELSFYTSDIAGKFKVVAQGVTTAGVVHGEYVFNVVK